ncbi:hypothetical protein GCM10022248_24680 [Nonomuraea soli]
MLALCALRDLARVESVLLDRLNLVQITVEKDDNAFRTFESINNTGMRLSLVDLMRNYVFMCRPRAASGSTTSTGCRCSGCSTPRP